MKAAVAIGLVLALSAGNAAATDYPTRPIRLIVPFAAGGPTDVAGRLIAQALRTPLGQPVYVENRGGGGGVPATEYVVNGPIDGYTLLVGGQSPLVIGPAVKATRYDVEKDIAPIGVIWRSPQVLVVHPKLDVRTIAELIALARKRPGKINFGSAGNATTPHLSLELFKREAGIDLVHVPYRSTGAGLPDLLSGQIDGAFGDISVMTPHVLSGALVGLAVTSKERSALRPDVATTAEAGFPSLVGENIYGLVARGGLAPDILARLEQALQAAVMDPDYRAGIAKQGALVTDASAEGYRTLLRSEAERWGPIARDAGLRIE